MERPTSPALPSAPSQTAASRVHHPRRKDSEDEAADETHDGRLDGVVICPDKPASAVEKRRGPGVLAAAKNLVARVLRDVHQGFKAAAAATCAVVLAPRLRGALPASAVIVDHLLFTPRNYRAAVWGAWHRLVREPLVPRRGVPRGPVDRGDVGRRLFVVGQDGGQEAAARRSAEG